MSLTIVDNEDRFWYIIKKGGESRAFKQIGKSEYFYNKGSILSIPP